MDVLLLSPLLCGWLAVTFFRPPVDGLFDGFFSKIMPIFQPFFSNASGSVPVCRSSPPSGLLQPPCEQPNAALLSNPLSNFVVVPNFIPKTIFEILFQHIVVVFHFLQLFPDHRPSPRGHWQTSETFCSPLPVLFLTSSRTSFITTSMIYSLSAVFCWFSSILARISFKSSAVALPSFAGRMIARRYIPSFLHRQAYRLASRPISRRLLHTLSSVHFPPA